MTRFETAFKRLKHELDLLPMNRYQSEAILECLVEIKGQYESLKEMKNE